MPAPPESSGIRATGRPTGDAPLPQGSPSRVPPSPRDDARVVAPAGFWRRAAAWLVDMALLSPLLVPLVLGPLRAGSDALLALLGGVQAWTLEHMLSGTSLLAESVPLQELARRLLADPAMHALVLDANARIGTAAWQGTWRVAAVAALYFVVFEAGPWSATPGKRLLGLRVVDRRLQPVRTGRAAARFAGGILSWLTLNLGHALAGFRRDHRALHDLVAGTQVLGRGPMPGWARAMLAVAGAGAVLVPLAFAVRLLAIVAAGH